MYNPLIEQRESKKIHFERTNRRIDHRVNKLWKKGGNIKDPIEKKLEFLYDNNRWKQVGMYIRNKNILNPNFQEQYKSRSDCGKDAFTHEKDV